MQKSREYQGSKFAEGRLKLSTACTECHKRKQKCDQQQPCRHCARRYPRPECIYRTKGETGNPTYSSKEAGFLQAPRHGDSSASSSQHGEISSRRSHSLGFVQDSSPRSTGIEILDDENGDISGDVSLDTLDDPHSETYRASLSTLISRMAEVIVCGEQEEVEVKLRPESGSENREVILVRRPKQEVLTAPSYANTISVEPLHFLGITPTAEKATLLSAFVKILVKYTVTLDGNPVPNYYNSHFVPWSMKSPLLSHLSIFTAACFQSESQKIPPNSSPIVLSYKLKSISILNEMLRSKNVETATSNEAIFGVAILVAGEWYWSNFETVKTHMRGLVEMVRLRGGLGELEMHDFLKKMILIVDYNIAVTYDIEPSFSHNIPILPRHPPHMMCPLLSSSGTTFASHTEGLNISNETANILDNMRFLLLATTKQVDRPTTAQELSKLAKTACWTLEHVSSLPTGTEPGSPLANDFLYKSVRTAAFIYCRAVTTHTPLSQTCTLPDLALLWSTMWRISLSRWKTIPGIFLWIILSAIQGAETTPYGRFLKSMLKAVCSYMALDYWDVADGSCGAFVRLQRWLRAPHGEVKNEVGSGEVEEFLHIYKQ